MIAPVVIDCQWEPDGRPGASAGCYVAHVRWNDRLWTCVRPMLPGYGIRDGERLCVFPPHGWRVINGRSPVHDHAARAEFLAVVDAAIERELEAGAADYAADYDDQGGEG